MSQISMKTLANPPKSHWNPLCTVTVYRPPVEIGGNLDLLQFLRNLIFDFARCYCVLNSIYIIRNVRFGVPTEVFWSCALSKAQHWSIFCRKPQKSWKSLILIEFHWICLYFIAFGDFADFDPKSSHRGCIFGAHDQNSSVGTPKRTFLMIQIEFRTP